MALPKRLLKKPSAQPTSSAEPSTPQPIKDATFTDEYGIEYIGGNAKVRVGIDIKMSRNYQSAGMTAGIEFTTSASKAAAAIPSALTKVRKLAEEELQVISRALNEMG
jgi:hypothetical protein